MRSPADAAILLGMPFAHRGLYDNAGGIPENSLASFAAAKDARYGIELDVALTHDGVVIAFHDDGYLRLCGIDAQVKETSRAVTRSFRLLGTQERVPSLEDVLALVGGAVPLLVELKSFDALGGFHDDGRLEDAVIAACAGYQGALAFKSFNPGTVTRLKGLSAPGPVGFLACDYARDGDFTFFAPEAARSHAALLSREARAADFLSYNIDDLTEEHRAVVKATPAESGTPRPLLVWTVRTPAQALKAQKLADNVVFELRDIPARRFRAAIE